jgi:hypothetical protein
MLIFLRMSNLTFIPLINVTDVNHWSVQTQWTIYQQNQYQLFLQIQDIDQPNGFTQDFSSQPRNPLCLRYMPSAGSTLTLTINDLNSANVVTPICSQPFSNDTSIWSFNLSASQTANLSGGTITATFVDGLTSVSQTFVVQNVLKVLPSNRSSC